MVSKKSDHREGCTLTVAAGADFGERHGVIEDAGKAAQYLLIAIVVARGPQDPASLSPFKVKLYGVVAGLHGGMGENGGGLSIMGPFTPAGGDPLPVFRSDAAWSLGEKERRRKTIYGLSRMHATTVTTTPSFCEL